MKITMVNQIFKHADLFPNDKIPAPAVYKTRAMVKGIILDEFNRIALVSNLPAGRHGKGTGTYFLPGGWLEDGDSPESTLKRETMEEVGCDIKIIKKFASTEEYRDRTGDLYKTECFLARVSKEEEDSEFIPDDSLFGPESVWIPRAEAIDLLTKQTKEKPTDIPASSAGRPDSFYNRKFNTTRDLFFVKKSLDIDL